MSEELDKRIRDEKEKIQVKSYYPAALRGSWFGTGGSLWGAGIVGTAVGALMGLASPVLPWALGLAAVPLAATLPISIAVFATVGMSMGVAGGVMAGRAAGGAAAAAKEAEKRQKEKAIENELRQDLNAQIDHYTGSEIKTKQSLGKKLRKAYYEYFNPYTGVFYAGVGLAAGLIMAAAFIYTGGAVNALAPALGAISGLGVEAFTGTAIAANAGAITAYFAGAMTSFGALFAINVPKLASEASEFMGEVLGGRKFGRQWMTPEDQARQAELKAASQIKPVSSPSIRFSVSEEPMRNSFQELVAKSRAVAAEAGELIAKR